MKKVVNDNVRITLEALRKAQLEQRFTSNSVFPNRGRRTNRNSKRSTQIPIHHLPITYNVIPTPWSASPTTVDVSIIVPLFRSRAEIRQQIESWDLDDDNLTKEIIYVDDKCPQESFKEVFDAWADKGNSPNILVVKNERNGGFGGACNIGASLAHGKYLVFLNADVVVTPNWLKPMIDLFHDDPEIGIVGNLHLKRDDVIDSCGSEWDAAAGEFLHIGKRIYRGERLDRPFTLQTAPSDLLQIGEREMVTGACFAIPRSLFETVEGFDRDYLVGYWEDTDLNMKVRMFGYKVMYTPHSVIYHKGGHSQGGCRARINQNIFFEKWVNKGLLRFIQTPSTLDKSKIVAYTAITGTYDLLKERQAAAGIKFIAFLEKAYQSDIWDVRSLIPHCEDSNRNAKIYKIMPHLYFPDVEYSVWIDGSIIVKAPLDKIIQKEMGDADLLIHQHPLRRCAYEEAQKCIQLQKDDPAIIEKQILRYKREGYPVNNGLVEAGVIIRRHNERVQKFNEAWWEEIQNNSKRDQISFNYIANKVGLKFKYFPISFRFIDNPYFYVDKHNAS